MNSFVIIGGAGYVGIELVNRLLIQGCESIIIVTRNTSKKILFRDPRVQIVKSLDEVKRRAIVINLAFANTSDYFTIKQSTSSLINSIKRYHEQVGAYFILHVSTIVLSESGIQYGRVSKKESYVYSKSLQENLFIKSFAKSELAIVRAGNILSPHSPWLVKLSLKLINNEPLKFKGIMAPTNATSLDFLVGKILELAIKGKGGYFNCCELSGYTWDTFVDYLANLLCVTEVCEFDSIITKRQNLPRIVLKSWVHLGITLNTSPWHGDALNRLIGMRWLPLSKELIRRNKKFRAVSKTNVSMKMGKEFKLFCDSRRVVSDFEIDYDLKDFKKSIEEGIRDMGFS